MVDYREVTVRNVIIRIGTSNYKLSTNTQWERSVRVRIPPMSLCVGDKRGVRSTTYPTERTETHYGRIMYLDPV